MAVSYPDRSKRASGQIVRGCSEETDKGVRVSEQDAGKLAGRVALVTGAGRGLGREIALAFGRAGADVAVNYRKSAEGAEQTAAEIRALGRRAETLQADVSVVAEGQQLVAETVARFGRLDILVNNAGTFDTTPLFHITEEAFDTVLATDFKGPFFLAQAAARQMVAQQGGSIISLASGVAKDPDPGYFVGTSYAGAKAALWRTSQRLAMELGPFGVRVNVIVPGFIHSMFDLGWRSRVTLQVAVGLVLAMLGTRVTLFWPFTYPAVGGLVTVLWVVGLMNAFAFLDNMDGLATGVGVIASATFAATQVQVGGLFAPAALLIVAGALGGVWVFNRYPARLFLGTSGSWLIGFLLGALTIAGTYYRYEMGDSPNGVLSPLLVMAVPFYESAVVFLLWLNERDHPFLSNPRHFSYRLQQVGLAPAQSVGLLLLVSLGAGLGSLLLRQLNAFGTAVLLGQTTCLIGVVALVEVSAIRRQRASRPGLLAAPGVPEVQGRMP